MRKAILKAAFVVAVFLLALVFMFPGHLLMGLIIRTTLDASGHQRGIDPLVPAMIALWFCFWVANGIVSRLFQVARLSDERWSVFSNRLFRS